MTTGRLIERSGKHGYVISAPRDVMTGKRKQIWRTGFRTLTQAREAMYAHITTIETGGVDPNIKVSEYFDEWLKRAESNLAPRTREIYSYTCARYITPTLGNIKLADLKPAQIESLYAKWQEQLQPSSVHRIHRVLRTALNRAVKWGYLKASPMGRVDPPNGRIEKRRTLAVDDAHRVLAWLKDQQWITYQAVYLVLYTGLRRAEVAGLRWSDLDTAQGTIHIQRNRQRRHGDIVGLPKTPGSNRYVPLATQALQTLKTWRTEQIEYTLMRGESWNEESYVVRHIDGGVPDPNTFTHTLQVAFKALDIPAVSLHDLRHTYATWLIESGVELKVVSGLLGHSSYALTADTYVHVTRKTERDAAERLGWIMDSKNLDL